MPKLTRTDISDPNCCIPDIVSAAQEAVARLKFVAGHMFTDDIELEDDYEGYDKEIVREQIERIVLLLDESLELEGRLTRALAYTPPATPATAKPKAKPSRRGKAR